MNNERLLQKHFIESRCVHVDKETPFDQDDDAYILPNGALFVSSTKGLLNSNQPASRTDHCQSSLCGRLQNDSAAPHRLGLVFTVAPNGWSRVHILRCLCAAP